MTSDRRASMRRKRSPWAFRFRSNRINVANGLKKNRHSGREHAAPPMELLPSLCVIHSLKTRGDIVLSQGFQHHARNHRVAGRRSFGKARKRP
jgi:hypothetical protein